MKAYLKSVLITMTVCQLLLSLCDELWNGYTKRIMYMVCGTVMLLTLFAPLTGIISVSDNILAELFPDKTVLEEELPEKERINTATETVYGYMVEEWFDTITETYPVERSMLRLQLYTDENRNLISAELTICECPYALRRKIEKDMQSQMEIPITVKGE